MADPEHALWLDAQFSRATPASSPLRLVGSAIIPRYFDASAFDASASNPTTMSPPPPTVVVAPTHHARSTDTAAGGNAHRYWLERQFSEGARQTPSSTVSVHAHSSLQPPAASRHQEFSAALPAGVNVLLRGQDASAKSHGEWLERQLARGGPPGPPAAGQQYHWQSAPTAGRPDPIVAPPITPYMPSVRFSDDGAAGSTRHNDWLENQLTPRKGRVH